MKCIAVNTFKAPVKTDDGSSLIIYRVFELDVMNPSAGAYQFIGSGEQVINEGDLDLACLVGVYRAVKKYEAEKFYSGIIEIGRMETYKMLDGVIYPVQEKYNKMIDDAHFIAYKMRTEMNFGEGKVVELYLNHDKLMKERKQKEQKTWTRFE